jgi:hypothetical protein
VRDNFSCGHDSDPDAFELARVAVREARASATATARSSSLDSKIVVHGQFEKLQPVTRHGGDTGPRTYIATTADTLPRRLTLAWDEP